MQGVITGFATISGVIAVGYVLALLKVIDEKGQDVLTRVSFGAAMPALMITMLAKMNVRQVFSAHLVVSVLAILAIGLVTILLARLVWRRTTSDTVIAAWCACYVNSANLGLPIAAYVLGDATQVVPTILIQVCALQPLGLAVLDLGRPRAAGALPGWVQPLTNPLTLGTLAGVVLALVGVRLPAVLDAPLTLLGALAVPANLLVFGASLHFGPRPGRGEPLGQLGTIIALKLVAQPLVAYALAAHVWHLGPAEVMAITVIAALPTAQNVYINASRYGTGTILARDSGFVTTLAAVPVLLALAYWLHP